MSTLTLEGLIDTAASKAAEDLPAKGQISPHVVALSGSTLYYVPLGHVFSDKSAKTALAKVMPIVLKAANAERYVLVSEAWSAQYENATAEVHKLAPSEREDRQEVVLMIAAEPGRSLVAQYEIIRDGDGTAPRLGERQSLPDGTTSGRFSNFFDAP